MKMPPIMNNGTLPNRSTVKIATITANKLTIPIKNETRMEFSNILFKITGA